MTGGCWLLGGASSVSFVSSVRGIFSKEWPENSFFGVGFFIFFRVAVPHIS